MGAEIVDLTPHLRRHRTAEINRVDCLKRAFAAVYAMDDRRLALEVARLEAPAQLELPHLATIPFGRDALEQSDDALTKIGRGVWK